MEEDYKPVVQPQRWLNPNMSEVVKKEVLKLLDAGLIYPISDSAWVSPVHVVPKKGGMTVIVNEKKELIPSRTVIGWRDNSFTAYRRMPFGLCNAPPTFQRCMVAIFQDMIETSMEVFMDDFSVFGSSFDHCLQNLDRMLARCVETNMMLNWEKCHFMVTEGIVLGHKISRDGIEVDRAKIETISKLPPPTNVRAVRSFLALRLGVFNRFPRRFLTEGPETGRYSLDDMRLAGMCSMGDPASWMPARPAPEGPPDVEVLQRGVPPERQRIIHRVERPQQTFPLRQPRPPRITFDSL
ncbi:hypothetical protein E3N88_15915 [Mikania micrantha]|uniref:Reverse transcriptase domain-containing protein n=1 Tax=Mikania micrantha TaxID=192012 RepID=A0A5N6P003_9ASTR|nr:hypothetical protein E3N88_15915 [Mikania micrantha]